MFERCWMCNKKKFMLNEDGLCRECDPINENWKGGIKI